MQKKTCDFWDKLDINVKNQIRIRDSKKPDPDPQHGDKLQSENQLFLLFSFKFRDVGGEKWFRGVVSFLIEFVRNNECIMYIHVHLHV